jgi:hypothetical protein
VIHDVDESLRVLLARDVMNGSGVEVSFETPSAEWAARRTVPALNLYLYDIQEDLKRREGLVVERTMPPRRYRLSYLVTGWTQRPEDEHRLLSAVLSCFIRSDALPAWALQGGLEGLAEPILCTVALPLPPERSISDVWSTLGGGLKASLDLVLTVPFVLQRYLPVGPPVTEEPFLRMGPGGDGGLEDVRRRRASSPADKADPDAPEPRPARETFARGKMKVGRSFEMISHPKP